MPDIGFGEIVVMVVLALLVFGPDRLPKMAADAARTLRQVRQMAAAARKDLVDASGLKDDQDMAQVVRDLKDLDPRRTMKGVLTDDPAPRGPASTERAAGEVKPASAGPAPGAQAGPATPVAPPVVAPAPVDPDWT